MAFKRKEVKPKREYIWQPAAPGLRKDWVDLVFPIGQNKFGFAATIPREELQRMNVQSLEEYKKNRGLKKRQRDDDEDEEEYRPRRHRSNSDF